MTTFSARLQQVMRKGNLTAADLARWFDRPDPTVRSWLAGSHIRGPALDIAFVEAMLVKIEKLVQQGCDLPVPQMTRLRRHVYLETLRKKVLPRAH